MWLSLFLGCEPMVGVGESVEPGDRPAGASAGAEPVEPGTGSVEPTQAGQPLHAAVARLEPRSGSRATGTVTFRELPAAPGDPSEAYKSAPSVLNVTIELSGATPGEHAVHVHERGDCSAPDASSAGGHFAPLGHPHGRPDAPFAEKHPGDLGNVTVGDGGRGRAELSLQSATLGQGRVSIDGLAVVVHAQADQFTQPSGDAGGRIACGIIEREN